MQMLGQRHGRQGGGCVEAPQAIRHDERLTANAGVGGERDRGTRSRSNPLVLMIRSATASVGDLVPCSYVESVGCEVPERRASSRCVSPLPRRARSMIVPATST